MLHTLTSFAVRASLLASFALFASTASAQTIYVNSNLTTGSNDGSSWADAFQGTGGLKVAQAAAVPGDQIFVAQGTYLADPSARNFSFSLANDIEIYGSFLGTEASPAERPTAGAFGASASILQGDLAGNDGSGIFTDNSFHVVRGNGTNASAVLDGFLVANGNADGGGGNNDRGAGILCINSGSPIVRGCHFLNHRSTFGGAGGYVNGSAPNFTDCVFENGQGGAFGGAFDIANSGAVRFDRCQFLGNRAVRAGALEFFQTSGAIVSNCLFVDNVATGTAGGGGLWIGSNSNPQVRNCTIVANQATSNAAGGIRVQGASPTISNCVLWDNEGPGGAQGSANQVTASANVQYSIVEGGLAGTGNTGGDPMFADAVGGDFSLGAGSAGIDAGNNALVPAGISLDLGNGPRFADDPSVADTGAGMGPIVDMGAYEVFVEPEVMTYCVPKLSSAFCVALIGTSNAAAGPVSGASDYNVTAVGVQGFKNGLVFGGFSAAAMIPFNGGTLCTAPPLKRGPIINSLGSNPNSCDGTFSTLVNDGLNPPAGLDAGAGNTGWYQYWYRDPGNGAGNLGTSLSDAVRLQFQ